MKSKFWVLGLVALMTAGFFACDNDPGSKWKQIDSVEGIPIWGWSDKNYDDVLETVNKAFAGAKTSLIGAGNDMTAITDKIKTIKLVDGSSATRQDDVLEIGIDASETTIGDKLANIAVDKT